MTDKDRSAGSICEALHSCASCTLPGEVAHLHGVAYSAQEHLAKVECAIQEMREAVIQRIDNQKLVLMDIRCCEQSLITMHGAQARQITELSARVDRVLDAIQSLNVRSGVWGAIGGTLAAAGGTLWLMLK